MSPEEKIEQLVGKETGFRVPEGYFEELYSSLPSQLPERTPEKIVPLNRWQRLKPYVYLAAMFAGIWCMMQMFHHIANPSISLEDPPAELIAAAEANPLTYEDMMPDFAITDIELEQAVSEEFGTFEELSKELGELEPEYASMEVNVESILPVEPIVADDDQTK